MLKSVVITTYQPPNKRRLQNGTLHVLQFNFKRSTSLKTKKIASFTPDKMIGKNKKNTLFHCFWNIPLFIYGPSGGFRSCNLKSGGKKTCKSCLHHPPDFMYPGIPGQSLKSSSFSILWYGPQGSQHRVLVICDGLKISVKARILGIL